MIRRFVVAAALTLAFVLPVRAEDEVSLLKGNFSFDSPVGTYDHAALERGLQIYKEVCSNCHALEQLSYRDLSQIDPKFYTEDAIKAFAAQYQVADTDDDGQPIMRPARAADKFVRPFPNAKAARAANNGGLPPNLALITKAREGGPSYVYSLLQGYKDAPANVKVNDGQYYNIYFPGHLIAMPPPLTDDAVTYTDGTKATLDQEAHDIATFLAWAAEPSLEERHALGVKVILFLIVTSIMLYIAKRRIWSKIH